MCKFNQYAIPTLSNAVCFIEFKNTSNQSVYCSGMLLNNERKDRTPYILTARHCITSSNFDVDLSSAEITAAQNSAKFFFRYRKTACGGSTDESSVVYSGAIFRAADFFTDFALLEIKPENLPLAPDLNYAGWNRDDNEYTGSVLQFIAHPGVTPQQYGRGHRPAVPTSPDPGKYPIVWDENSNVANQGASGGSLLGGNMQVIGMLSYGWMGQSLFGRMSESWARNGTGSNRQLKAWLSPTQNLTSIGTLVPMSIGPIANVCNGQTKTATLPDLAPGTSVFWSATSPLSIVSSTANSVTVTTSATGYGGVGQISATYGPTTTKKDVYYGVPDMGAMKIDGSTASSLTYVQTNTTHALEYDQNKLVMTGMTSNMNWNPSPTYGYSYGVNFSRYDINLSPGSTIDFNPVSATNSCGTASRSMRVQTFSSFAMYPNPASEMVSLKFDNTESVDGLPEDVSIYSENAGKLVRQVSIKSAFDQKQIKGNVLPINVGDLPRGTYYMHVKPNKKNKKETDKIRLVLN